MDHDQDYLKIPPVKQGSCLSGCDTPKTTGQEAEVVVVMSGISVNFKVLNTKFQYGYQFTISNKCTRDELSPRFLRKERSLKKDSASARNNGTQDLQMEAVKLLIQSGMKRRIMFLTLLSLHKA